MKRNVQYRSFAFAIALFLLHAVQAQNTGYPDLSTLEGQKYDLQKPTSKVSPNLMKLYDKSFPNAAQAPTKSPPAVPDDGRSEYMQVKGDKVLVDIIIMANPKSIRQELAKLGVTIIGAMNNVISGWIPINVIPQLESVAGIRYARPAYRPMHRSKRPNAINQSVQEAFAVSPVISQGDTAQRSYMARSKFNVNGKGVKVGILSDSYDILGGAEKGVLSGELPGPGNPFNYTQPVEVLEDYTDTLYDVIDEGRGMAELIHDVAPGAALAFHTAFLSQTNFAQGILDLAKAGCQVICDDVSYSDEPFFQDGMIAQAVDNVKQQGIAYFSSAGNSDVRSYESNFRGSNFVFPPLGAIYGTAHNFSAPGDTPRYFLPVTIPRGATFLPILQWDQPFYSQGMVGGPGAETDLDMYLLDSALNIVALSDNSNIFFGDPYEDFSYVNRTGRTRFYLLILKYEGPDPLHIKFIDWGSSQFVPTTPAVPGINAPTIFGHPNAKGAIATGAVFSLFTPAYGIDTPRVESFSSVGGVPIYLDIRGNRITPEIRRKPEITAPDGGNNSFFGSDTRLDRDSFPNFFGTSAAAPHAAGVAALMLEAQRYHSITPDQVKGILSAHTVDMDNIYTPGFDKGFDFQTGTGLIRADAAVDMVRFPNVYVKNLKLQSLCSDNPSATRNWKVVNPNPFEVEANWLLTSLTSQAGRLMVPPGETTFSTRTVYLFNRAIPNIVVLDWRDNLGIPHVDIVTSTTDRCSNGYVNGGANQEGDKAVAEAIGANPVTAEVFPNPSSRYFRVYLSLVEKQNTSLELYSIDGKVMYKKNVQANGIVDIDASGYKPGVYMLKVSQAGFHKTIKLVRQ